MIKKDKFYKPSFISINMRKGFMKLNDVQLEWLGGSSQTEGRLRTIEVQKGCPWQCVICGVSAPKKSKNMPWSDYMNISDSILEVFATKKINILTKGTIDAFDGSDPAYYHSSDGKKEKTIYHVVSDLMKRHHKNVAVSTAGWTPGNNYMQRAIEDIVENYSTKETNIKLLYSIKMVSKFVRTEYDNFLEKNNIYNLSKYDSNNKFIKKSEYVSMVMDNLKTLAPITKTHAEEICFEVQVLNDGHLQALNTKYQKYKELFSKKFMDQLEKHIIDEWNKTLPQDENTLFSYNSSYKAPYFIGRTFAAMGNVLKLGEIEKSIKLQENYLAVNSKIKQNIDENLYFTQVNCFGEIEIYYGKRGYLSRILVPKEHFMIMAEQEKNKTKKQEYKMLIDLQGMNILR